MPTRLKRLTIQLPDEVKEAVEALSKAQGVPQTKVIISVLSEFAPVMLGIAKITAQVKAGEKQQAKETMRHLMGDALAEVIREQMELGK